MTKSIVFSAILIITIGIFFWSMRRIFGLIPLLKPFPIKHHGKRLLVTLKVALGQSRIFRRPLVGLAHALVFWGFLIITIGSIEMVIDGISGQERIFAQWPAFYHVIIFSGDIFSVIVLVSILAFLFRRTFLKIKRFYGIEMKPISKIDATAALLIIFFLMISLLGTNTFYILTRPGHLEEALPVSKILAKAIGPVSIYQANILHEIFWWSHILLIFLFANILPYSKHFHVFTSIPNVYLSRLEPLGKMEHMPEIEQEVRMMLDPEGVKEPSSTQVPGRFGVKDVEDLTWKNYLDSLACTECGRCTDVCPANITGKKLSPRKIIMDVRARAKEKRNGLLKHGQTFDDGKALLRDYISEEELWACTTCNACARECPVNINQPLVILAMRRYLTMEEGSIPALLASMLSNIENNGAPWQYPAEEREAWMRF
ncbi:MAG: 4Fe-4S dicluster domain-containing protein [Bacteroidales bacterium]|nr:4Fe-4S dicluster domain-containing protein [Bacteroidales bacterium]NPV36238.1 4Fe-4S dicluster domain-containing protein [Bacteroidales bacterium]